MEAQNDEAAQDILNWANTSLPSNRREGADA
jgi:hypothetical protein